MRDLKLRSTERPDNEDAEAGPAYEVVEYIVDEGDDDKCRELVVKTMEEHPDLACFVGMNAQHGPILLDVLKEKEKLNQIKVVAFDEEAETLAGVRSGEIYAAVVQDPYRYGYEAVRLITIICRGEEGLRPLAGSKSTYNISAQAIRKDNLDAFPETAGRAFEKRQAAEADFVVSTCKRRRRPALSFERSEESEPRSGARSFAGRP